MKSVPKQFERFKKSTVLNSKEGACKGCRIGIYLKEKTGRTACILECNVFSNRDNTPMYGE